MTSEIDSNGSALAEDQQSRPAALHGRRHVVGRNGPAAAKGEHSLSTNQFSKSLARGLAVLRCFSPERPTLSVAEISDALGMTRSTAHRYAATLVALGHLQQDDQRRYGLATRASDVGRAALSATRLRAEARPELERLRSDTAGTVAIAVLEGPAIIYLDRLPSHQITNYDVKLPVGAGSRLPAYCTATGKMLLAHLPDSEREDALEQVELVPRAPNTITNRAALRTELDRIREADVAFDDEELAAGLRSIAAPILKNEDGEIVAAVCITVPSATYTQAKMASELSPLLLDCAERISSRLSQPARASAEPAMAS